MRYLFILISLAISLPSVASEDGLVRLQSPHSVKVTADKLEQVLSSKGMTIFARINHQKGAENSGLALAPTEQVIFGNPKIGTPLMLCEHSVAIDLPQKMLIWEDSSSQVWIAYNDPNYVKRRHSVKGCDEVWKKVTGALNNFAKAAISP
jgi:uncharacterized protein (DUF302 family)